MLNKWEEAKDEDRHRERFQYFDNKPAKE